MSVDQLSTTTIVCQPSSDADVTKSSWKRLIVITASLCLLACVVGGAVVVAMSYGSSSSSSEAEVKVKVDDLLRVHSDRQMSSTGVSIPGAVPGLMKRQFFPNDIFYILVARWRKQKMSKSIIMKQ